MRAIQAEKKVDLEAWETWIRRAVLALGAEALEEALKGFGCGRRKKPVICPCKKRMKSVGQKGKTLRSILGSVPVRRSLYVCKHCGASLFPGDRELGVEETIFTPGARRMMGRAGGKESFLQAAEDLEIYAELKVSPRDIERVAEGIGERIDAWTGNEREALLQSVGRQTQRKEIPCLYISFDGTGIPMRPAELEGRRGKGPDGEARTREVKLGCVFTATVLTPEGEPVRDPLSTTYVGAIETSEAFGWRLFGEAVRRGLERAQRVVVLTDGARYNKGIIQIHFPRALHIIDYYHVREHLEELARFLRISEGAQQKREWSDLLWTGKIYEMVRAIDKVLPRTGELRSEATKKLQYFLENANHMSYGAFRKEGLFIGSGVVEAGCRGLIGQRLKESGMFWSVAGANAIINVRCCLYSRRYEDFWAIQAG